MVLLLEFLFGGEDDVGAGMELDFSFRDGRCCFSPKSRVWLLWDDLVGLRVYLSSRASGFFEALEGAMISDYGMMQKVDMRFWVRYLMSVQRTMLKHEYFGGSPKETTN